MKAPGSNSLDNAVAVVGMGCRFPGSPDLPAFWRTVRDSRVWSGPIPRSRWNHELFYSEKVGARDHNKTYVNRLCMVEDPGQFAPDAFGISPRRARIMDPQQRLFLDAVRAALEDAGYAQRPLARDRVGTYVGATVSDFMDLVTVRMRATLLAGGEFGQGLAPVDAYKALTKDLVPLQAYTVVGSLLNMVAANVNQCFDFGGPAFTTDAACSSALVALHEAVLHLRHGICDTAIVGGVYMVLSPDNVLGFARIGAVSMANACRPFDQRADGFVVGEGVGAVVLKRLSQARADHDHIYAVIRGVGINNDGRGEGPMTPRKEGQVAVLDRAYTDAQVDPRTIDFVEAHGTATPVGDATEVSALAEYRGAVAGRLCALSSVKANVGHSMSAAGIAGLIRGVLSVDRREITPHAAYEVDRPELALQQRGFYVPQSVHAWQAPTDHPRRAGVNSFGFGGTNVHVVLEEAPCASAPATARVTVPAPWAPAPLQPHLFVISAPTLPLLQKHAADLRLAVDEDLRISPEALAYTLSLRKPAAHRAAFVATTREQVLAGLQAVATTPAEIANDPTVFVGQAVQPPAKPVFLFPGQGAQTPGLARDLYDRFTGFRRALDDLTQNVTVNDRPLLSYLYPRNGAGGNAMAALTKTEVCQPIMAAVGLATAQWLRTLGVEPVAVAGHSLGEFAAAADAGVLPPGIAVQLVATRGLQIERLALPDPGAMAALAADHDVCMKLLAGVDDAWVANINHPRQTVISGTTIGVDAVLARAERQAIKARRLQVSHAFHSPLMQGLKASFEQQLERLPLQAPTTTVVSCVAPGPYPQQPQQIRQLWTQHATLPVNFVTTAQQLAAAGGTVFVQMGAGHALANMARASLSQTSDSFVFLSAAAEIPDGARTLLSALAQLYVLGVDVKHDLLFEGQEISPITVPPSVLETRHLWPVKKEETHPPLQVGTTSLPESSSMSKFSLPHPDARPTSAELLPTANELGSLFRQQMAVLETHAAIMRQQNELLLRQEGQSGVATTLSSLPPAQTLAAAPVQPPPSSDRIDHDAVSLAQAQAAVIGAAARITASPAHKLGGQTRLGADLGFDSLMVVELSTALSETFVGLELPRSAFAGDTTIEQLAREVVQMLAQRSREETPKQAQPLGCHAVRWQATALPAAGQAPVDDALVFVIATDTMSLSVGSRLVQRLSDVGRAAQLVDSLPDAGLCEGAHLIDLRPLAIEQADDLGAPVLRALRDAQTLDAGRPASWRLVRANLATAGLDGFAKSLNQEWEHTAVASWTVDPNVLSQVDSTPLVAALANEVTQGSTCCELRFALADDKLVRQTAFTHTTPLPMAQPAAGNVVLLSGGAQGLGAKLARALLNAGVHVGLLGRRLADDNAVKALLDELRGATARAHYMACDVRKPHEVAAAVAEVTQVLGPVTMVVHAAGVCADALVANKNLEAAASVLATKLQGAQNLWNACAHAPLQAFLALGSLAGRFGNVSQTDYAAANGALAPLLQSFHEQRPNVRTSVLDLPPWEGGGLLNQLAPAARKALAMRVRFATDEEGLPLLLGALSAQGPSGEFVVAPQPSSHAQSFAWQRTVRVDNPGYLADHIVATRPVLPMAGAIDWMLQAAGTAGHTAPFLLSGVTVVDGVVLDKAHATLRLSIDDEGRLALVRVDGRARVGFRAQVQSPQAPPATLSSLHTLNPPQLSLAKFYAEGTFHGPSLRAITSVSGVADNGVAGEVTALAVDGGTPLVAALDGVLQLVGYWATEQHGRGGLPLTLTSLFVGRIPTAGETLTVRAHTQVTDNGRLKGDADVYDTSDALVFCMRGFEAEPREHQIVPNKPSGPAKASAGNGHANGNGHHNNGDLEASQSAIEVPSAHFRIDEFPEVKDLQQRMAMAKAMNIAIPYFRSHEGINAATATIGGQTLINFSSYNYLGFSGHPEVTEAAKAALDRYGSSVSASRIASGERPLHSELEAALAQVLGVEDAIVMVGGHATNVSVLGHLLGPDDLVVHDSLAHDSILGGAKLSGARRRPFPHNDTAALERILRETRSSVRRVLIAIEGVYSMDGDIAPLDRVLEIKRKYGALLLVDEAHSIGVLGATGRGVGEHFDVNRHDVDLWMGTLSKSFASCGGYIAGSHALVQYLRYTVPGFVYSVGISPANAAAALAAIRLMQQHPELPAGLREKSKLFLQLCRERGLDTGPSEGSAVIPCVVGNSYICLQLSQALLARGINVQPILYPAVEENQARLRFFISVTHTEEQLRSTADILAEELFKLKPAAAKPIVDGDPAPPPAP